MTNAAQMRTEPRPIFYLCGEPGELIFEGLEDCLFGSGGRWNVRQCLNTSCRLGWLDPMPLEADIAVAYRQYYTHGERQSASPAVRRRVIGFSHGLRASFQWLKHGYLAAFYGYLRGTTAAQRCAGLLLCLNPMLTANLAKGIREVRSVPNGTLLDIGCGDGSYLLYMRSLGWTTVGQEVDAAAVAEARRKGVEVRHGSLFEQHFAADCFDQITLNHVLEHVHEPRALLEKCLRVLKPGGTLTVFVANLLSAGQKLFGPWCRNLEPPRHIYHYTPQALTRLAETAGFRAHVKTCANNAARGIYLRSSAIVSSQGAGTDSRSPRLLGLKARLFGWYEYAGTVSGRLQGEEILLQATKP